MIDLKLRAWDFEKGRMLLGHELYERLTWSYGTELPNEIHLHNGAPYIAYMRYTGLHDRNGTEIYEDDVVKVVAPKRVGEVASNSQHLDGDTYKVSWGYIRLWPFSDEHYTGCDVCGWMSIVPDDVEVIGNIYSNPKLVEKAV